MSSWIYPKHSKKQRALGDVLIIADRFHYMRQVYWAFDEVRRQVQRPVER
ncbi:transposase [Salipaludibacillus sp. CF4.18]